MSSLEIKLETKQPGSYILTLKGEMDHEASQGFTTHAQSLIDLKPKRILLDMSGVSYISSASIGALFHLRKQIKEQGGVISLCSLQHQVRSILDATKGIPLEDIFETREDCDEALRNLQDLGQKLTPVDPLHQDPDPLNEDE